jgi:hypothetical protein
LIASIRSSRSSCSKKKRQRIQAWHGRQRSLASVHAVDFASPFHCVLHFVKARFVPACLVMAALPAGNFCDQRFLSRYAKRFSRSHAETKGLQTTIDRSMA